MLCVLSEHECQICSILFMCLFSFILDGVLLLFLANIKKYKFTLTNYALIKLYLLLHLFPSNKISYHEWGVSCVILLLLFMHLCWSTHTHLPPWDQPHRNWWRFGVLSIPLQRPKPIWGKSGQSCRLSIWSDI